MPGEQRNRLSAGGEEGRSAPLLHESMPVSARWMVKVCEKAHRKQYLVMFLESHFLGDGVYFWVSYFLTLILK